MYFYIYIWIHTYIHIYYKHFKIIYIYTPLKKLTDMLYLHRHENKRLWLL